jgi:paraquat-inducible protein B
MAAEPVPESPSGEEFPEAVVQRRSGPSIVWLIPLVAAVVAAVLAFQAVRERGAVIQIAFKSAEGLEAGKTKIRFKNVEVGQVTQIHLSEDLGKVIVIAEMERDAADFLTEATRFWVVRARLGLSEISGLSTLFSGAYIAMEPGTGGEAARRFEGLDAPPVVTADVPGSYYRIRAERLDGLDVGAPIFFRRIRVGQVVGYRLAGDGKSIDIRVFVEAPHDRLVRKNTRFYNAGGIDATIGLDGVQIDSEALVSILVGGLAFETPTNLEPGGPASFEDVFDLYPNRASINEPLYARKNYYLLHFNETVRGLKAGAPVEFRGIRLGEVVDIKLEYDTESGELRIPVLIEIEPDRIDFVGGADQADGDAVVRRLVDQGLRAQIKTGNLLTGLCLVNLDFFPNARPAAILYGGRYPVMPTVPTPITEMASSLAGLMDRLEALPIEEIADKLRSAADGVDRLVNAGDLQDAARSLESTLGAANAVLRSLSREVAPRVDQTLDQVDRTLTRMEALLRPDSPLQLELIRTAEEMAVAARAIRSLADYLDRHPEALIRGKRGGAP